MYHRERFSPYKPERGLGIELGQMSKEASNISSMIIYLNQRVIGQDYAIGEIAKAIHNFFMIPGKKKRDSIVMIGPEGVGKEYTLRIISEEILDIPFLLLGIGDLEEGVRTHEGLEWGKGGIVCINGFDTLKNKRIQNEILGVVKGERANAKILHAFTGIFEGLEEVIKRRMIKGGKEKFPEKEFLLETTQIRDLEGYGLTKKFVNDVLGIMVYRKLRADDFYSMFLSVPESLAEEYRSLFGKFGTRLKFTNEAVMMIAKRAEKKEKGAMGLREVCEEIFRGYDTVISRLRPVELEVNREMIKKPKGYLIDIINEYGDD